jgi:hypothetical protein
LDAKFKSEIALFIESYFKTHPEVFKGERGDKGDPLEVDEEELERLVENCMRRMNRRVNWMGGAEPIRRLPAAAVDFAGNVNTVEDLTGSSGSSLVGFMPSGTGAVSRTVQAKLRELGKSPEDFGAVGDGVTSDQTAIQAWIDSVPTSAGSTDPGWVLRPSPGKKYTLTAKITIGNRRIAIIGNGMTGSGSPSIFYQTDADADFFDFYTGNSDVFSVYGVMFLGQGKATGTGNALRLGRSAQYHFDCQIHNCWFANIPNACIYADYVADLSVQNCGIEGSKYGIYYASSAFASGDINKVTGNTFYALTYGIYAVAGANLQIAGNQFNLCGTDPGGTMDNTSGGIVLIKGSSPSVRATLIATNMFRANVNDIIVDGSTGSAIGSNTGVIDTNVVGNTSDRCYRRFILVDDADGTRIIANTVTAPNAEGGAFDAFDITDTSDGTVIDGNSITTVSGGEPRYGLSLGASTVNTVLGNNKFAGSSGAENINASATLANESSYVQQGTWTPAIGGDATYTLQEGYYRKQGKLVFIKGKIVINVLGTGSTSTISGLPFAAHNATNASVGSGSVSYFASLAVNVTFINPVVVNNTSTMTFTTIGAAGATATNAAAVFGNSTRIDFSATYMAAQ